MTRERPDTAAELRHAEGKLLVWDACPTRQPCALQPRDTEVLAALGRYRFLTTVQIADRWWPGRALQVVRRRLTKLFEAGYVERFRPQTIRGSYQWVYCMARDGHRAAQQAGELGADVRFTPRREQIFDYRYVIHDLRLNDWVIAYTELTKGYASRWHGPDDCRAEPPKLEPWEMTRDHSDVSIGRLKLKAPRPVAPDAGIEVMTTKGRWIQLLVEYDRTRRVDKNYDKFRRYDSYLSTWWFRDGYADRGSPYVLFLCEDEAHLERFLAGADRELTGIGHYHRDGRTVERFHRRERVLFATASGVYEGSLDAYRVPRFPPGHEQRQPGEGYDEVPLPGPRLG
jgi:hypothetical protein